MVPIYMKVDISCTKILTVDIEKMKILNSQENSSVAKTKYPL